MENKVNKGQLMGIKEAGLKAGISDATIRNYAKWGLIDTYLSGTCVYYRDILRASWVANQRKLNNKGNTKKEK